MKTIGRRDKIDLPELSLFDLDAKIDSGARSSSIHCHNIEVKMEGEEESLHFNLLDPSHEEYNEKPFSFTDFYSKKVKSSSGHTSIRYFIKTTIVLFGEEIETEFNLSDRSSMNYPVLLGRRLLRKRFLIDVSKKNMSFNLKHDKKKL